MQLRNIKRVTSRERRNRSIGIHCYEVGKNGIKEIKKGVVYYNRRGQFKVYRGRFTMKVHEMYITGMLRK
jgi:hypothetical protein